MPVIEHSAREKYFSPHLGLPASTGHREVRQKVTDITRATCQAGCSVSGYCQAPQPDRETGGSEGQRRRRTMKFKTLWITAMTLLTVVAAVRLPAQGQPQSEKKEHIRYKLIDIGTFGGPNSGNNGESTVMNNQGAVVGFA